jgi:hypothetical protein
MGVAHKFILEKYNVKKTMYREFTGFFKKLQHKYPIIFIWKLTAWSRQQIR